MFKISQHIKDDQLLKNLVSYFGCGRISSLKNSGEFIVTKFKDLTDIIILFFDRNQIVGEKVKDFQDFKKVAELMKNKVFLTTEGLEEIRKIKMRMNRGRNKQ